MIDRPIILLGTQRSSTTYMGGVFSEHPSLAYWSEPRHVWTWGNSYRKDDVLTASDVTPRIKRHIHKQFSRFVNDRGRARLIEKTPSNCLRISFIHEIFPDAIFIQIIRDGRSVIQSTKNIMSGGIPSRRIVQRALETPVWGWPAYMLPAMAALKRKITKQPLKFWGPRPSGWRQWLEDDPPHVVLARQWAGTITRAIEDGQALPSNQYFRYRYEEFVNGPRQIMERIFDVTQLESDPEIVDQVVSSVDPSRANKWREAIDQQTLDAIRPVMEPVLQRLGYDW
ncbi:MAG: sulfotransferase [Phycisphaerales bacterium]|nr:sulfotransferase [Phycisphaerales bacterium]